MRLFTVMLLIVTACGSTAIPATPAIENNHSLVAGACRDAEPAPAGLGVDLVLEGVARAQTNDLRCGPPKEEIRVCRALFVLATLDPTHYLEDPPQFRRVNDAQQWALDDALMVAPPELAPALQAILTAIGEFDTATNDIDRTKALVARADPAVTDSLDSYWEGQCQ